jgi:hypothetical protein
LIQGLGDFKSFSEYREGWIKPNLIPDLETVFEGALVGWERRVAEGRVQPEHGRGDFVLGGVLFSTLDQFGAFLGVVRHPLNAFENIMRILKEFSVIKEFALLVTRLSRNSLTHCGWPRTGVLMENRNWAIGLNVSGDADLDQHNRLYVRREYEVGQGRPGSRLKVPVVKFRINVHAMLRELIGLFEPGQIFGEPKAGEMERIDDLRFNEVRTLCEEGWELRRKHDDNKPKTQGTFHAQAVTLRDLAINEELFRKHGDEHSVRICEAMERMRERRQKKGP